MCYYGIYSYCNFYRKCSVLERLPQKTKSPLVMWFLRVQTRILRIYMRKCPRRSGFLNRYFLLLIGRYDYMEGGFIILAGGLLIVIAAAVVVSAVTSVVSAVVGAEDSFDE